MNLGGEFSRFQPGHHFRLAFSPMAKKEYPPVPADLEKWELRGGFASAILSLAILIFFLEQISLHFGVRIPVPHHKNKYKTQYYDLVPEFWISVALSIATLFATYLNRRQILAILIIFQGLMLVSFSTQFDPLIPLPFVIFGVWLMLRASRRTRQLSAQGMDYRGRPVQTRAQRQDAKKGIDPKLPKPSKRYTPPTKKRGPASSSGASVGIGRGGMIRGDLPRKSDETESPLAFEVPSIIDKRLKRDKTTSKRPQDPEITGSEDF